MSPETIVLLKDFGFPALVSAALGYFIIFIMKSHREERAIDRQERKEIAHMSNESTDKLAEAIRSLEDSLRK